MSTSSPLLPSSVAGEAPVDPEHQSLAVPIDGGALQGEIVLPRPVRGVVLISRATSQGRMRSDIIATALNAGGFATAMFTLLTGDEEALDASSLDWRFDIELLSQRLNTILRALQRQPCCSGVGLGLLATSGATAAAIATAVELAPAVQAIVSRDGRPDLAEPALRRLTVPTLLVVRREEEHLVQLNRRAAGRMPCIPRVALVGPVSDLFEEAQEMGALAVDWFARHIAQGPDANGRTGMDKSCAANAAARD